MFERTIGCIVTPLDGSTGIEQQAICRTPDGCGRQVIHVRLGKIFGQGPSAISVDRYLPGIRKPHLLQIGIRQFVNAGLAHLYFDPFARR